MRMTFKPALFLAALCFSAAPALTPAFADTTGSSASNAANDHSRREIGADDPARDSHITLFSTSGSDEDNKHDRAHDDHKSMDKESMQSSRGQSNDAKDTTSGDKYKH